MIRPQWLKKQQQSANRVNTVTNFLVTFSPESFNVQIEDDAAFNQGCGFGMTRNIK